MIQNLGKLVELDNGLRIWNARDVEIPRVIINGKTSLYTFGARVIGHYVDEKPSLKDGDLILLDPPIKNVENSARKIYKRSAKTMGLSRKKYEQLYIDRMWANGLCVPYDPQDNSPNLDTICQILTVYRKKTTVFEKPETPEGEAF